MDEPKTASEDALAIVLAEFRYWSTADCPVDIAIGATAAAANIYCAMRGIHRAPWHPPKPEPTEPSHPVGDGYAHHG